METCLSRRRAGLPPILAPRWLVPRHAPRRAHQREEPARSTRRSQRPPGVTVEADARARCQSRQSRTRQRSNPARFRHHHLDPTRHQTARHTSPPSADPPRRLDKYALSTVPATRTPRRPRSGLSQVPSRPANATRSTPSRDPRPPQAPAAARTAAQESSRRKRGTTLYRSTTRTSAAEPLSCPDRTTREPLANPRSARHRRFSFVANPAAPAGLPDRATTSGLIASVKLLQPRGVVEVGANREPDLAQPVERERRSAGKQRPRVRVPARPLGKRARRPDRFCRTAVRSSGELGQELRRHEQIEVQLKSI